MAVSNLKKNAMSFLVILLVIPVVIQALPGNMGIAKI